MFDRKGLEDDLKRAVAGTGADAGAGGDRVEVKIRSLTSSSRYYRNGYFHFFPIVYGFGLGQGAKDITSTLDAEITIVRNGKAQTREYSHVEYATVPRQRNDRGFGREMNAAGRPDPVISMLGKFGRIPDRTQRVGHEVPIFAGSPELARSNLRLYYLDYDNA